MFRLSSSIVGSTLTIINLVIWAAVVFWLHARGEQFVPGTVNIALMLAAGVCFALCYRWIDRRLFASNDEERRRLRAQTGDNRRAER